LQASDKDWAQLQGKFLLNSTLAKATIYIEGPQAGVDLLLDCLVVKHAQKAPPSPPPDFEVSAVLLTMKFVVLQKLCQDKLSRSRYRTNLSTRQGHQLNFHVTVRHKGIFIS
jgi:hypothetical protein